MSKAKPRIFPWCIRQESSEGLQCNASSGFAWLLVLAKESGKEKAREGRRREKRWRTKEGMGEGRREGSVSE